MKTILKVMFLLCGIGFIPSIAKAQEKVIIDDEAPNGIVMVTIDKAGDEIVRIMNESQFRYIHDPKAPRFLLMDKKGNLPLVSADMCVPLPNMTLAASWTTWTSSLPTFRMPAK